jgi:hypothetical protein
MREREGETMILECDECHSDTEILYKVDGQEICTDCLADYLESAERLRTISCSEIRLNDENYHYLSIEGKRNFSNKNTVFLFFRRLWCTASEVADMLGYEVVTPSSAMIDEEEMAFALDDSYDD